MYELTVEAHFDAAHALAGHEGKCRNIHGHRWKVILHVESDTLVEGGTEDGMIMDFSVLKKKLKEIMNYYDHSLILQEGSVRESTLKALYEEEFLVRVVPFRPTAENFARSIFNEIRAAGLPASAVTVYESQCSSATYRE